MARPVALATLLASVVFCAVAFTASDSPEDRFVPASPTGQPPGTVLADGFTVPDGTLLLGDVFDTVSTADSSPDGKVAVLLVQGDGVAVTANLVRQAEQAGFALAPVHTNSCWTSDAGSQWWTHPSHELTPGQTAISGYACEVYGENATMHAEVWISTYVGAGRDPYLAYTIFQMSTSTSQAGGIGTTTLAIPAVPAPLKPLPPANVPAPGSRLGAPYLPSAEQYYVVPGTTVLAPVAPYCPDGEGGFISVLRAPTPPDDAFARYGRQLLTQDELHPAGDVTYAARGRTIRVATIGAGGGGNAYISAVTEPDGTTFLLVARCRATDG
jgi:hypothetical protein